MLIMTPNVDVEKASEVEMPVIVDQESDEFVVVHVNPERSNGTPTHNTSVSAGLEYSTASRHCAN